MANDTKATKVIKQVEQGQVYIHLTDKDGAKAIRDSQKLWKSSFADGVYAIAKGASFVPGVQMTRLGRAKNRAFAVYFTTPELPSYCTPEECVWKLPEIPVRVLNITSTLRAKQDLDGSLGILNKDSYRERLLIPTKEMPDPNSPPSFLIDELKTLVESMVESAFSTLSEEIEEAAKTPELTKADGLSLFVKERGDKTWIVLYSRVSAERFVKIARLARTKEGDFQAKKEEMLSETGDDQNIRRLQTREDAEKLAKFLETSVIYGIIVARVRDLEKAPDGKLVWRILESGAEKGYGPLLYEALMSRLGKDWLGPDSVSVSLQATNIWKRFYERTDIEKIPASPDKVRHHQENPELQMLYRPLTTAGAKKYWSLINTEPLPYVNNTDAVLIQLGREYFSKKYAEAITY